MSNKSKSNQKHMELDDRIYIEKSLDKGLSFKEIAAALKKDPTTIAKEINHINSSARESLNGRTPFKLASLLLDKTVLKILELEEIDPDKVILRKKLLK